MLMRTRTHAHARARRPDQEQRICSTLDTFFEKLKCLWAERAELQERLSAMLLPIAGEGAGVGSAGDVDLDEALLQREEVLSLLRTNMVGRGAAAGPPAAQDASPPRLRGPRAGARGFGVAAAAVVAPLQLALMTARGASLVLGAPWGPALSSGSLSCWRAPQSPPSLSPQRPRQVREDRMCSTASFMLMRMMEEVQRATCILHCCERAAQPEPGMAALRGCRRRCGGGW